MDRLLKAMLFAGLILVLILAGSAVFTAYAGEEMPEGLFSWYDPILGATCYVWPDGSGDCYCPCEIGVECDEGETIVTTRVPETPVPTEVPTEEPTEQVKVSCNRGIGNGSEDCDPGNSGGKPGSAGEDNE